MISHSINYFLFTAAVFLMYYFLPKKIQPLVLLISSLIFCAMFSIFTAYSALFSILLFYYTGIISINKNRKTKKIIIKSGICIAIANIIVLKYVNDYNHLLIKPVIFNISGNNIDIFSLAVPIGISYYTFTGIGYLIEILNERIEVERNILTFANFIIFFPKFSAGPIERANNLLAQLKTTRSFNYDLAVSGTKLIMWGMFKKVVIADRLAVFVDAAYKKSETSGGLVLLLAAVFYSFQIYADFSGYTDIARGSARILGFNILDNFKRPYFARSISEFWTRWHISLSSWIRDYVFLPLAYKLTASKNKLFKTNNKLIYLISTAVTMTIIGIWHGIGIGFILWSSIHIIYLFVGFIYKKKKAKKFREIIKSDGIRKAISTLLTFAFITFSWIFFRAESGQQLITVIRGFFSGYSISSFTTFMKENGVSLFDLVMCFIFPLLLFSVEFIVEKRGTITDIIKKLNIAVRFAVYIIFTLLVLYFSFNNEKFIYYQF